MKPDVMLVFHCKFVLVAAPPVSTYVACETHSLTLLQNAEGQNFFTKHNNLGGLQLLVRQNQIQNTRVGNETWFVSTEFKHALNYSVVISLMVMVMVFHHSLDSLQYMPLFISY